MKTVKKADDAQQTDKNQISMSVSDARENKDSMHIVIDIKDDVGEPIEEFETSHEKLMHLVIVSDNLQFFDHVHPTFVGGGRFEVDAQLPFGGGYTFFSDYQRSGKSEKMSVLRQTIEGEPPSGSSVDTTVRSQTVGDTKVSLRLLDADNTRVEGNKVKAGSKAIVQFNLRESINDRPIEDLRPYLGTLGHLVAVKQSTVEPPVLTRDSYNHVHSEAENTNGQINFITSFSEPGLYKLWGEFSRDGQSVVTGFWIEILPSE